MSETELAHIYEAAENDGTPPSTWARERLVEAAAIWEGNGPADPPAPTDQPGAGGGPRPEEEPGTFAHSLKAGLTWLRKTATGAGPGAALRRAWTAETRPQPGN